MRKGSDGVSGDDHLFSLEVRPCFYASNVLNLCL